MASLVLIGASGLAREALAIARESGLRPIGVLDDAADRLPRTLDGVLVLGPIQEVVRFPESRLLVCIRSGATRARIVERLATLGVGADRYAVLLDRSVRNPGHCPVGPGSVLFAGVAITVDAVVGRHVVAMPGATIAHDCVIGDFATLGSGVSLGGGAHIGRAANLGLNVSVRFGAVVGAGATIGMGSAVLDDVPPDETWAGVPAAPVGDFGGRSAQAKRNSTKPMSGSVPWMSAGFR
ncbi:acetyltransferase [Agromyces sp. ISL-38]|uniref:PglD-related sugar-binding protein n=1 Tax=Agromyces sp. ISL-38 TaxID=2819107 RepID=UPI001BEC6EBE|nr:acetyltransferase [Agromyces sp. ISL-38]MBT2497951.1 acetyltransferase [Agromyces sp. ISL-38]MBT2516974.1 acetyltransferase [Streptomyces sp. ISL-90]